MTSTAEIFETKGCVEVSNFLDSTTISTVSQYLENKLIREEWGLDSSDGVTELSYYADPLIEIFLVQCKKSVEEICGRELLPTYSFARVYQPGEDLRPHLDREACEISVTVNVANTGDLSPIYMQYGENSVSKHFLNPGDAVVYKGCEVRHWRLPMESNQTTVQFMLHYVDKNGPFANHVKDTRPSYSAGLHTKRGN